jgi:hypothetical protein
MGLYLHDFIIAAHTAGINSSDLGSELAVTPVFVKRAGPDLR